MRHRSVLLVLWGVILISGCRPRVDYLPGGSIQTGTASWYGEEFHGKSTSSKEVYDMNDLTAAHNTLPLGTYVMVTNLDNGKSIAVRINDRGPFVKNRIIDLSYAAARALDMIGPGTAPVRIEVLGELSPSPPSQGFSVQVGAFIIKENADRLRKRLEEDFAGVRLSTFSTAQQTYYRVRIKAKSRAAAETIARNLAQRGFLAIIFEEP